MAINGDSSELHAAFLDGQVRPLQSEASPPGSCEAFLRSLILFAEQLAPGIRCSILIASPAAGILQLGSAPNMPPEFLMAINATPIGEGEGSCGTAAARRELVVVNNIDASPLCRNYREVARAADVAACWSMPLFDDSDQLLGTFATYYSDRRVPKASELDVVRRAASLAAMAIQRFRDSDQLRAAELRYRELAEKCPDPMLAHVGGRLIFINQTARDLLQADAVGPTVYLQRYVPEHLREQLLAHRSGPLATQLQIGNGPLLQVEITATPLIMDHQPATVLVVRDVTRRVAIESALFEAESRIHGHLAFDLHDGVGQQVTGISLMLRALAKTTTASLPALSSDFKLLSDLASKCINDIRILAGSMAPVTVERVGLGGALKILRQKAESIYGLDAHLSMQPAAGWSLDSNDANHLFRVVQEAIGNAARHAKATRLEIDGRVENDELILTITDDGIGIPSAAYNTSGLGLRSMRYRAERIGGRLEIKAHKPHGTIIQVRYPWNAEADSKL